jgi:hypothetical protein
LFRQRDGLFQIEQPDNWNAYNSTGYGVTFAPAGGIVNGANGSRGVVLGVIVNHYVPFEGSINSGYAGQNTLAAATSDLVQQVQQGNSYLQRIPGSDRRLTVSGHPSYSTVLVGSPPGSSNQERLTVVTAQLPDDHVIYMLLVGPDQDYAAISPTFNHMLRSLRINESARHD